jgi:phosphoribosyl-ATP pyrophosphohydrolase
MMSYEQYLLLKLAEEALEVAHRAMKAMQFGLAEVQVGQGRDNQERIEGEIIDFIASLEVLKRAGVDLSDIENADERVKERMERSEIFLNLSRKLGKVEN